MEQWDLQTLARTDISAALEAPIVRLDAVGGRDGARHIRHGHAHDGHGRLAGGDANASYEAGRPRLEGSDTRRRSRA